MKNDKSFRKVWDEYKMGQTVIEFLKDKCLGKKWSRLDVACSGVSLKTVNKDWKNEVEKICDDSTKFQIKLADAAYSRTGIHKLLHVMIGCLAYSTESMRLALLQKPFDSTHTHTAG